MQASLAIVGTVSGILAYASGLGTIWLLAALLLGSVVPITLLVIKPVNDQLMSQTLDSSSSLAGELLARWEDSTRFVSSAAVYHFSYASSLPTPEQTKPFYGSRCLPIS